MFRSRRIAWAVVAAVAFSVVSAASVLAADSQPKVGVVNLAKVYADAPRMKQYREDLDKFGLTLQKQLETRAQNLMLAEAEVKELIDMKLKPAESLTQKEKDRVTELEAKEKALDGEFKTLQGNTQLPEDKKPRLKELQDLQAKAKTTGEELEKDYQSRYQTKGVEMEEKAKADIADAAKKVAEAKGFSMVITKEAVLFGGTDITDDVVNNLDRKVQ